MNMNKRYTYVIGDLQGCFAALKALLKHIEFDPSQDFIYFAGDLVARGEDSLSCLRFVKKLVENGSAQTVLGNHDLTLIACARGFKKIKEKDKTKDLIDAIDSDELIDWLRKQPLLIEINDKYVLTHAGIPHIWDLSQAKRYAQELEQIFSADFATLDAFLAEMYGNEPDVWHNDLTGHARYRMITNYFTRMRIIHESGRLDLQFKESLTDEMPVGFRAWFDFSPKVQSTILFGHWAALQAKEVAEYAIALDGGCVWGGELVAFEINQAKKYAISLPCD